MNIIYDLENAQEFVTDELLQTMEKAALLALERENVKPDNVELSLTFVDKDEIKDINWQFRNIDKVTDVLSFPQYESPEDIDQDFEVMLGDVVICSQVAKEQAEEFGHSLERELMYLFVHSIFHLLGYDHMVDEDKVEMRAAEEDVLGKMNITRD